MDECDDFDQCSLPGQEFEIRVLFERPELRVSNQVVLQLRTSHEQAQLFVYLLVLGILHSGADFCVRKHLITPSIFRS